MRTLVCTVVLMVLVGGAHAGDRAKARVLYEEATTHYKLGEFDQALLKFKETYRNVQDPALLFNIGQCYRQLNQYSEAIRTFKAYLTDVPDTSSRSQVREMILQMETAVREAGKARAIPPTGLVGPEGKSQPPPDPEPAKPPLATAPPPSTRPADSQVAVVVAAPPSAPAPRRRAWVWGVVGGAAAVVALGLGLGLGLGLPHDSSPSSGTVTWK